MPPANVLDVWKNLKKALSPIVEKEHGFTIRSGGTKELLLDRKKLDVATGYWANPPKVANKPPRWILQIEENKNLSPTARISVDQKGNDLPGAKTLGYINNRDGRCVAVVFRILAAVRPARQKDYEFPGWEWLLVIGFSRPLLAGTSSGVLTAFDPQTGTLYYRTLNDSREIQCDILGLVTAPLSPTLRPAPSSPSRISITYPDATAAIDRLLSPTAQAGANVYDGTNSNDLQRLTQRFKNMLNSAKSADTPTRVETNTALIGIPESVYRQINAAIAAGKRHFIFYGPPGTGKTTLAQHVASQLSDPNEGQGYIILTASSSWSSQDLIGGYQPLGRGRLGFIPGVLLRNFNKPIVIDELNRCPIDKVIGPIFSVLSGQATTLPYRNDVTKSESDFYVILPDEKSNLQDHEFAPGPRWRLICTLNTIDKTQLGQISYALSRRFAWIKVGIPENLEKFVVDWCHKNGIIDSQPSAGSPNPIAGMWNAVNKVREIGGAPIIDFIAFVRERNSNIDIFATLSRDERLIFLEAFQMYILPLLDGILRSEAEQIANEITNVWSLDPDLSTCLTRDLNEMAS